MHLASVRRFLDHYGEDNPLTHATLSFRSMLNSQILPRHDEAVKKAVAKLKKQHTSQLSRVQNVKHQMKQNFQGLRKELAERKQRRLLVDYQ